MQPGSRDMINVDQVLPGVFCLHWLAFFDRVGGSMPECLKQRGKKQTESPEKNVANCSKWLELKRIAWVSIRS